MLVTCAFLSTTSAWLVLTQNGHVAVTAPLEIAPLVRNDGSGALQTTLTFSSEYGPRWKFSLEDTGLQDLHLSTGTSGSIFHLESETWIRTVLDVAKGGILRLNGTTNETQLYAVSPSELSRVSIVDGEGSYLSVYPKADFYSTLSVAAPALVNTLSVADTAVITGSLSLGTTLSVSVGSIMNSLSIYGDTDLTNLEVHGDSTLKNVAVTESATIGQMHITSTLDVDGAATLDDVTTMRRATVLEDSTFTGNADFRQNVSVGLDVNSTMDVNGNANFFGNVTFSQPAVFLEPTSAESLFVENDVVFGFPTPTALESAPVIVPTAWWDGIDGWLGANSTVDMGNVHTLYAAEPNISQSPYHKARVLVYGTLNVSRTANFYGDFTVGESSFGHEAADIDTAWNLYYSRTLLDAESDPLLNFGPPTFADLHHLYKTATGVQSELRRKVQFTVYGDAHVGDSLSTNDLNVRRHAHIGADLAVSGTTVFYGGIKAYNALTVEGNVDVKSLTVGSDARFPSMESYAGGGYLVGKWVAENVLSSSDRRLKNAIQPLSNEIPSPLDAIRKLVPASYKFHDETATRFGFIADEIQKVFPSLVHTLPSGFDGVNYQDLIPILVLAIQEQSERQDFEDGCSNASKRPAPKSADCTEAREALHRLEMERAAWDKEKAAFRTEIRQLREENQSMTQELLDGMIALRNDVRTIAMAFMGGLVFFLYTRL